MSNLIWSELDPLPESKTWLLEASAGTGKTYQIASIYLRLVAEYGISVDRILAITFTNAATAELRDRIRTRLRGALEYLRTMPRPATDDVLVRHLDAHHDTSVLVKRIELGLRTFDLAPISTIHGFSQRMLQDFSFDSDQDAELELLTDTDELINQLVNDTLADLYSRASALELAIFQHAGMTRENLIDVANRMSGATRPRVLPECLDTPADALARAHEWAGKSKAMHARWTSEEAMHARSEMEADVDASRLYRFQRRWIADWFEEAESWFRAGAIKIPMDNKDEPKPWFRRLDPITLQAAWRNTSVDITTRPWWLLVQGFSHFLKERTVFWQKFAPVAVFANSARGKLERELARRRVLTFDGMLSRLAERVKQDGDAKSGIAERIRNRFDAAFVDEFQDTDDAQWQVISSAFHGYRRLFLIGDPKQAIYAFRGANVHVYLKAADIVEASQRRTMNRNWRSDPKTIDAINALFLADSKAFDDDAFDSVEVKGQKPPRTEPVSPGLILRWIDNRVLDGAPGEPIDKKIGSLAARFAAREAAAWLNGERGRLIDKHGKQLEVMPENLAVLVNDRREAEAVRRALARAGIPAVAAAKESVFQSPVVGWLASWMQAVAGAGRDREARTAAVTPLFGWRADELAWALAVADRGEAARAKAAAAGLTLEERDWNDWTERIRNAFERWTKHGFARTLDREMTDLAVLPRVLALPDGERLATDLRHLFELLHTEDRKHRPDPAMLATWLRTQARSRGEEASRRLESDAHSVRIETIHVSKGLQYPVVLLPFCWAARKAEDKGDPLVLHGQEGARVDVNLVDTPQREESFDLHSRESRREDLRKTYVALTRAEHCTVAWYGPVGKVNSKADDTAIGRLLLRDPATKGYPAETLPDFTKPDAWATVRERLDSLTERSAKSFIWQPEEPVGTVPILWRSTAKQTAKLNPALWPEERKSLSGPWLVTSYSGLAKGATAPEHDEKCTPQSAPEPDDNATSVVAEKVPLVRPPLAMYSNQQRLTLGRGTEYGTMVHEAFELIDFTTGLGKDGRSARDIIFDAASRVGLAGDHALIAEIDRLLPALLDTPLGSTRKGDRLRGLPSDFTLRKLGLEHRIDEHAFDLRLGDGTEWRRDPSFQTNDDESLQTRSGCVDPKRVYDAILGAEKFCGSGLAPWFSWLRSRCAAGKSLVGSITGILTGSIDLVFRTGAGPAARYFIADYKTNKIAAAEPGHYASVWLDFEMCRAGYLLQSLIYTLALHRHLSTRLYGYDYDKHIGGYLYLFLRGMSGAATPRDEATGRCLGVFAECWPKEVVTALDAALCPARGERS